MNLAKRIGLALCVMPFATLFASPANASELRIRVEGPDRAVAIIEKAEALLVGWGWTVRVPLPVEGNIVRVPFESPALRAETLDKYPDLQTALLYIRAEGLAPIISDPFSWPGSKSERGLAAIGTAEVRIDFRDKRVIGVKKDADQELLIELKRPSTRQVRILDDIGKPIRGLKLATHMFWSNENHCGSMSGAELLATGVTDDEGRVSVPDGDFEYALELLDPHVRFSGSNIRDTNGYAILRLTDRVTTLWVHPFIPRPLTLRVFSGNMPLAGVAFSSGSSSCDGCGTCGGPIPGTTDSTGTLLFERFYPEDFERICLLADDGSSLWNSLTRKLDINPVDIRLPAGTSKPKLAGPCPPER